MWCHIFIVIVVVLFFFVFFCFLLLLFCYFFYFLLFFLGGCARFRECAYVDACVLHVSINKNVITVYGTMKHSKPLFKLMD